MPNPGDEWAAGEIPEEPMPDEKALTPDKLRLLRRRGTCTEQVLEAFASAWEADRAAMLDAEIMLRQCLGLTNQDAALEQIIERMAALARSPEEAQRERE